MSVEDIELTLKSINFQADVHVSIDNGPKQDFHIILRFVFIEVGQPFVRCVIFLPEYGAARNLSKKKENEISLLPFTSNLPKYTISSEDPEVMNIIFNLASTATMSLSQFNILLAKNPITLDRLLIAQFPKDPFPIPITVHLENGILKIFSETDKKEKTSITISNSTIFHIPPFKSHPQFGLTETPDSVIWFSVPTFQDVEQWYIIIKSLQQKIHIDNQKGILSLKIENLSKKKEKKEENIKEKEKQINEIEVKEKESVPKTIKLEIKSENVQKTEEKEEVENQNLNNDLNKEAFAKENDAQTQEENIQIVEEIENSIREKKKEKIEKQKQEVEKLNNVFKAKLQKYTYKRVKNTQTQKEPELTYPTQIQISPLLSNSKEEFTQLSKKCDITSEHQYNDLTTMIFERLVSPHVSMEHYISSQNQILIGMSPFTPLDIKFDYNPLSEHSFITKYLNSSPEETFILLMALIKNGFIGSSISKCFCVPKKAEDGPIAELRTIISTHKTKIFDFFLQNENNILENYSHSALCYDFDLLRQIKQSNKELKYPEQLPDVLPFRFEHKPEKSIMHWLFTVLYDSQVGLSDVRLYIYKLSQCLQTFFSHYLKANKTIEDFFQQIMSTSSSSSHFWTILKKSDQWSSSWFMLWLQLYKNGNLIQAFKDIFCVNHHEIINEIYEDCSCVKDIKSINVVYTCLYSFMQLRIPANYECEKVPSDFTIFGFSF